MATKREREAEDFRRRKLARLRMRNLIRSVMFNRIWLQDPGDQKMTLNVKRNVVMIVRPPRKVGILTMAEKTLFRTNHIFRTIDDRKKLVTLISSLSCFSKLPPKVRARMVPVLRFMYLEPGRTIIREKDRAQTIYFILTGDVEVTKRVYDPLKQKWVERLDIVRGPGECLGDFELIEEIPRTCSCTAASDVELLVLGRDDFDRILRPSMAKLWYDKKEAILDLGYFNYLNKEELINTTKAAILRQFEPLETIYYEDKGHLTPVHFVLSGDCMILQCLRMKVTEKNGRKTFSLLEISKEDGDLFQDLTDTEQIETLNTEGGSKETFDIEKLIASDESIQEKVIETPTFRVKNPTDMKSIEIQCGLYTADVEVKSSSDSSDNRRHYQEELEMIKQLDIGEEANAYDEDSIYHEMSDDISTMTSTYDKKGGADNIEEILDNMKEKADVDTNVMEETPKKNDDKQLSKEAIENENPEQIAKVQQVGEGIDLNKDAIDTKSKSKSQETLIESIHMTPTGSGTLQKRISLDPYSRIENHFIDVGSMAYGGIFGLGEKLEHRVIMARTTVQCLMIPRFWLFEKERNPGNLWQRRRFYVDSTIPSRESLFQDFLATRRWQKFKKNLIARNLGASTLHNSTKPQDIPIICHIIEGDDSD